LLQCHFNSHFHEVFVMKRFSLSRLFLMTFLLVSLVWQVSAQAGLVATVQQSVSLRVGAGVDWRRVATLAVGTQIALDGRSGDATWVRGITQNGQVGWLVTEALNISIDQAFTLPIIDREAPITVSAPAGGTTTVAPATDGGTTTTNNPAPIAGNSPITGFSYGAHVKLFDQRSVDYMRLSGMTWAKHQVRYFQGMTADGMAGLIADTHAKGFRVLLGVVGAPAELLNGGYYDAYAGYVAGLAALGADAIEVWNEPNIDREWIAGQINGANYTQLLAVSYNAIKGANANTLVISGAPAPTGFFGGCQTAGCDDAVFISQMAAAGAARYMDCVGVHYNEGIVPPTQASGDPRSEYFTRYYPSMVSTYSKAFGGREPLCFTELGYLSPEGYPPLPGGFAWAQNVTVAQQASWIDQVVSLARNSGKVRILIIWNMDAQEYNADPQGGYALIRPDGTCPACDALAR
jgi:uncharacterized protein YraI